MGINAWLSNESLDEDRAEQLGREAFEAGRSNNPFADDEIAAAVQGAQVGEKTYLLRAFNRGWTAANLAAPF